MVLRSCQDSGGCAVASMVVHRRLENQDVLATAPVGSPADQRMRVSAPAGEGLRSDRYHPHPIESLEVNSKHKFLVKKHSSLGQQPLQIW